MTMNNDLGNLIELHNWKIHQQNFLKIKDTEYTLSVIPEYSYFYRSSEGRLVRSVTPQALVLNTCIYNDISGKSHMYVTISSEEEFLDFMLNIQKQLKLELEWQD